MAAAEHELPNCPLFDPLTPAQRRELLTRMEHHSIGAGSVILEEGGRTPGLWIIASGRCQVVKTMLDGERVLAELGAGAVFGEMSFLYPAPHSATVRSVDEVTALKLPREAYRELDEAGSIVAHRIAQSIAIVLAERLRRMDEWTSRLLARSPTEKREEWAEFRAKLYSDWGV